MKVCPQCGETYRPFVDFCFADGEVLTMEAVRRDEPEADAFDAPPPPKMLQGTQGGGYTRSATPVPRARRPGRSILSQPDGGGVYTPPAEPTAPPPVQDQIVDDWADAEDDLAAFEEIGSAAPPPPAPQPILDEPRAPTPKVPQARQTPPAAPPAPADDLQGDGFVDEEPPDEQEEANALPVSVLMVVSFAAIAFIVTLGAAAVYFLLYTPPQDATDVALPPPAVEPLPTMPATPPSPLQVGPRPRPEPVPEPEVEPSPPPTEVPTPTPVKPQVPAPVVPAPVVPAEPTPVPSPAPEVAPEPAPTDDGVVEVEPPPTAEITFTTDPAGATVLLDGRQVGTTPTSLDGVEFGRHAIRYELAGHEPSEMTVRVTTSRFRPQTVSLTPVAAPEPVVKEKRRVMVFFIPQDTDEAPLGAVANGTQFSPPTDVELEVGKVDVRVDFPTQPSRRFRCNVPSMAENPSPAFQIRINQDCTKL